MATINEVIERVQQMRPDAVDDETKSRWLIDLDGQLFRETVLRHRLTEGRKSKGPAALCPV